MRTDRLGRWTLIGLIGGLLGSVLMILYAMVVSLAYKDVGFFTPLYHIGSAFAEPAAIMASMEAAMGGDGFYLEAGAATFGLFVHLLTGAGVGALFGALVSLASPNRMMTVLAGAVYGMIVMLGNAYVGLPIVAEIFGGGEPIADMPSMAGWGTFLVEHLIFGVVLGLVVATWATRSTPRRTHAARDSSVGSSV
ncbi:MAG: hypothetical protein WD794_02415 [Mycobacteriales bacterium]